MDKKPKGGASIPGQKYVPQVDRYTGSDVLGMERTTARPMSFETGADPDVYLPGKPWTQDDSATMRYRSTTNGEVRGAGNKRRHEEAQDEFDKPARAGKAD